ncbi:MAG: hypothetical protein ACK562_04355 [Acidobacteriota bacterium]
MARDKLITIRIEGEKREAFNNLAKSQNTDTASLLYDFISGCLGGKIDISLVTGKGNRIDKIDNQIDSDRIDKLEATTQEIDNRLDTITKKLTDWVIAFDDRLNDCGRELSEKMISLEHRLNALAMQLDSQQDSQQLDSIDTDSQQIDDMEPLLKRERESSIAAPIPTGETSHDEPDRPAIGTVTPEVSPSPPLPPDAIEDSEKKIIPLPDTLIGSPIGIDEIVSTDSSIKSATDAIETDDREWLTLQQIADKKIKGLPGTHQGLSPYAENWESRKNPTKKGKQYKIPREYLTPISPNPD